MPFILIVAFFEIDLVSSWLRPLWTGETTFFWIGFVFLQFLFASQLWLYFSFFTSAADKHVPFEVPLRNFAFHAMGAVSLLFTFTLLRDILALVFLAFGKAGSLYTVTASEIIFGLSFLCYLVGFLNARFRIESPRVAIPVEGLPSALKGLKIVQLSDMHLGTGPNHHQIKKLVDQANSLEPDLIALTGDIFDGMVADMPLELLELKKFKAKYGVYFCLGNHETYWSWQQSAEKIKEFGFVPLLNEGVSIHINGETIFVAGLNDPAITHAGGEAPNVVAPPPESRFNLMLVHQPQFAKSVSKFPYHLQLSGHTHGGQFFPWNLVVKKMYAIAGGLGKEGKLWVYVSHGSGYWGPPLRLGTQGEVTELVLE